MDKSFIDKLKEVGWQIVEQGKPLPEWVHNVVLCSCDKCHERNPIGRITQQIFRKPSEGWSPIIGWELWFPLP